MKNSNKVESKPIHHEFNTEAGMDPMIGGWKIGQKESCWQCYKLEIKEDMLRLSEVPHKVFWSHNCIGKYKIQNFIKCALEDCNQRFLKIRGGILVGTNWYCSKICAQKDNPEVDEDYEDEGDQENTVIKESNFKKKVVEISESPVQNSAENK